MRVSAFASLEVFVNKHWIRNYGRVCAGTLAPLYYCCYPIAFRDGNVFDSSAWYGIYNYCMLVFWLVYTVVPPPLSLCGSSTTCKVLSPKCKMKSCHTPFSFFANYAIGRKSFLLTIKVGKSEGKKEWRRAELIGNSSLKFWNKLDIKVRKGQNRFIFMSDVEEKKKVRRSWFEAK